MRYLCISILLVSVMACSGTKAEAVDPDGLYELMSTEYNLQLVDVRTPQEFKSGHLREALLIDMFSSEFDERIETLNKNQPIAVYCAVGQRSYRVYEMLQEKGFKEVYHLEGGIQAWEIEGKPLSY